MAPEPLEFLMSPGTDDDRVLTTAALRSGFDSIDSPRMANPTYSPANTLYSAVRLRPPARIGPFFSE
jgi:hypothetical protein